MQKLWKEEKRNPRYYDHEAACDKWLGFSNSSNEYSVKTSSENNLA